MIPRLHAPLDIRSIADLGLVAGLLLLSLLMHLLDLHPFAWVPLPVVLR